MTRKIAGPGEKVYIEPIPMSVDDVVVPPAANMGAVITYAALNGYGHVIGGISWSYSADPTDGRVRIYDGADVVYDVDVTVGGVGFIPFDPPKKGGLGNALVLEVLPGGAGIMSKVNALSHWVE